MNDLISSLSHWQELYALSNTMLTLARSGKWDELIDQEVKYVTLMETIAKNPVAQDNPFHQEQARQMLTKVLANEAELRTLLQHRMDELRELIDQTGRQKSLHNAYGKFSGNILIPHDFNQ